MKYKYKSKFDFSIAKFSSFSDFSGKKSLTKASIEPLKALMPEEEVVLENPDLYYTSFNSAVANLINANDDGILGEDALRINRLFINKPMNIEHMKSYIVGHVIGHGFSSFLNNEMLSEEALANEKKPFNMCLSAVVYKYVDEYFADYLNGYKDSLGASWEVFFDDYHICLGSKKIHDGELITDSKQIRELSKHLRAEGGEGFLSDGTPVYRVLVGDMLPAGCAFTSSPAAPVMGINVASEDNNTKIFNQLQKIDSHLKQISVNNNKIMKIKKIEDIQQDTLQSSQASEIRDFIYAELDRANETFKVEKETLEAETQQIKESKEKAEKVLAEVSSKLAETEKKLQELSDQVSAAEKQKVFDDRMASLSEKYELDAKHKSIIAKQIVGLTNEEFASWEEDFSILVAPKNQSSASVEEEAVEKIDQVKSEGAAITNTLPLEETKKQDFSKAFKIGEGVVINYK